MALACCLVASMTASAQFSATIEEYPEGYSVKNVTFALADVAEVLGTDATTLGTALTAWVNGEQTETNYFFLANLEDEERFNYTQGGKGGYWMTKDAKPTDWTGDVGDDAWYNIFGVDEEVITLGIGQHPDAFVAGEEVSAQFILAFNEKQATFDITLKVVEKEDMGIPEAVTEISRLSIAGSRVVEIHQYARTGYDSDEIKVYIGDALEAIGANPAAVEQEIAQVLWSSAIGEANEDGETSISNELTNQSTAGAHGWWFVRVYAMSDKEIDGAYPMIDKPESGAGAYANGSFYAEQFKFDAETDSLTCYVGQMPGKLEGGDEMYADLYLVWGEKAYKLTYKLIIDEREALPFDEMEEVGSLEFTVEQYPTTNYSTTAITLDLDAIAAAVDTEASALLLWAATEDGATDASSANNGGYWFNMDGYKGGYDSSASIFVEPAKANDFSTLNVGQYPGSLNIGDEITVKLYLIGNYKYYTVIVTMKVIEKPAPPVEFTVVAEREVEIQVVPSSNVYLIPMTFTIDTSEFESLIGTDSPTLLARQAPAEGEESWTGAFSDAYSCDPNPGFWMSSTGYASTWGSSPWGVTYADDLFTFYQMPNMNKVGDEFQAYLYLANMTTGAMVAYNVTVKFVSEVIDTSAKVVGQEDIYLPVDGTEVVLDLSKAMEALGVDDVSVLTSMTNQYYEAMLSNGTFSNPMALDDIYFKADGGMAQTEDETNNALLILGFLESNEDNCIAYTVELWGTFAEDQQLKTKVAFNVEGNRYIFNITFVSASVYTGVNTVKAATAADAPVFDLAGRRVSKAAQRGIYIQNGKKVAVK